MSLKMFKNPTVFTSFIVLVLLAVAQKSVVEGAGCEDDQSCTDLCGYAGSGTCVNGNYCKCATCPQRSVWEVAYMPKVCTLDPTCLCPSSSFSLTSGKLYSGHRCLHGTSLVCICFCMPTTVASLVDVVKCPFAIGGGSTTTGVPDGSSL